MPNSVVDSSRDEHKWKRAEQIAAKSGHKGDYAYVMGIYKRMKPDHQFKRASVNEPTWFQITGDILSFSSWDSEKSAASFAEELEKIARMNSRVASKVVKSIFAGAKPGAKAPVKYSRKQVLEAFKRKGMQMELREMGTLAKNPAMKGSFSKGHAYAKLPKTTGKGVPYQLQGPGKVKPAPASVTGQAESTLFKPPAGKATPIAPPSAANDAALANATKGLRGGEAASAEAIAKQQAAAGNVGKNTERSAREAFTREGVQPAAKTNPSKATRQALEAETAAIQRAPRNRQLPGPTGGAPVPEGYRKAYQKALDSGARPEQIMNPQQWAKAQAKKVKPTGRGTAPAATTSTMERMAVKADLVKGAPRGRTTTYKGKELRVDSKAKGPGYTDAQRVAAGEHATARKGLKSEQARLVEMQAAPTLYGKPAIAQQAAKVEKATAAVGTSKAQVQTATQARNTAAATREAEGVAKRDMRRRGAIGTERAKLQQQVATGKVTGAEAEKAMVQVQNKAVVGGQRDAARVGVQPPKPPATSTQAPPPVASAEAGAADAGKRSLWDKVLGRNKPPPAQPPPGNQPGFSPGMQSQLEGAAVQPGGFWQGMKNQWGQMTPNQKMMVGGAGIGAGAFMAGSSNTPQQPPAQPPMPMISYPAQPTYRQPPTVRAPRMVSYQ